MRKRAVIITAACVVVIGGFGLLAVMRSGSDVSGAQKARNAIPAQVEATKLDTVVTKVSVSGTVQFIDKTTIYAGSSAKAKAVNVKAGDDVALGQILIDYDAETLDTLNRSLTDALLSVRSAEINLNTAKQPTLTESETLQASNAVLSAEDGLRGAEDNIRAAQKGVDDVNAQILQADISYEQLRRGLDTAKESHRKTTVLYNGGVASKYELDNAADAVAKLEDQIKTAESQKASLLSALAAAERQLDAANRQQETAQRSLDTAKKQAQLTQQQISLNAGRSSNTVDLQELQLEQARRQVEKLQKDIDDFKETEPAIVAGTLLSLTATEGQILQKGQQIGVIADTSWHNLVIVSYVPENETKDLALGQDVEITGNALGKNIYMGKVTKILPMAETRQIGNSQEAAVTVEITPDDPEIPIKAGYTVDTNIVTRVAKDVVVVPVMAVISESGGQDFVYVVDQDNTVAKRQIKMLAMSGLYAEAENVSVGETVILNPSNKIKEGVTVKPSNY